MGLKSLIGKFIPKAIKERYNETWGIPQGSIPQEELEILEECERRSQKYGREKTGEGIILEVLRERGSRNRTQAGDTTERPTYPEVSKPGKPEGTERSIEGRRDIPTTPIEPVREAEREPQRTESEPTRAYRRPRRSRRTD